MKLLVLHLTGLATPGYGELDGRSLLDFAPCDALDAVARRGAAGTVPLLPEGLIGGAGLELLSLLGYLDPAAPPSLGALEATAIGAPLYARDVAFRVSLCSLDGSGVVRATSGEGIATEDALALMETVDRKLATHRLRFYPGRHTAHVMVWTDGPAGIECTPAPLAECRPIEEVLPRGDGDGPLRQLMWDSVELLSAHRINHRRAEEGLPPANLIWPWAPGLPPGLPHFALKTGLRAAVIGSRLEVLGAARAAGIPTKAPGQDLAAMKSAVSAAVAEGALGYLHLDLPALFEHRTDPEAHARTLTRVDTELVAPVLSEVRRSAEAVRLVVLGTYPETGWQSRPPTLWAVFPAPKGRGAPAEVFTEAALRESPPLAEAHQLLCEAGELR